MLPSDTALVEASPYWLSIPSESSQLRVATQFGLATPHYETVTPVLSACRTGNCQFPVFTTLAICSKVVNVTDKLSFGPSGFTDKEQSDQQLGTIPTFDSWSRDVSDDFKGDGSSWKYSRKATLPTGESLIGGPTYFSVNISYSSVSDSFSRISGPWNETSPWNHSRMFYPAVSLGHDLSLLGSGILNFYVIWLNQAYFDAIPDDQEIPQDLFPRPDEYLDQSFRAVEVLLHFCVKTVNTTVSNGSPKTDMSNTAVTSPSYMLVNGRMGREEKIYNITTIPSMDDGISPETFYIDEDSFAAMFYYLRRRIRGTFSFTRNPFWTVRGQTPSSEIFGDALWSSDGDWALSGNVSSEQGSDGVNRKDFSSIINQDRVQDLKIRNKVRNIADSLTNMLVHARRPSTYLAEGDLLFIGRPSSCKRRGRYTVPVMDADWLIPD